MARPPNPCENKAARLTFIDVRGGPWEMTQMGQLRKPEPLVVERKMGGDGIEPPTSCL